MARQLRIEYPGAFYHVLNRGVERRSVFSDFKDYECFVDLCSGLHRRFKFRAHSYCLMPNHYHLYLETPEGNLSSLMHQLDGIYTQRFNRRHRRVGPLFQGRYKAILVEKESYSIEISRYIHLNPVQAKLVPQPEDYPWSSYAAFLGRRKPDSFLETQWLLSQFGLTEQVAQEAFHRFTLAGTKQPWEPERFTVGGILLGGQPFVEWAKRKFCSTDKDHAISQSRELRPTPNPTEILAAVNDLDLNPNLKRKLSTYALRRFTHLRLKEVGALVGGLSEAAASQIAKRIEEERQGNSHLNYLLKLLDENLLNVEP